VERVVKLAAKTGRSPTRQTRDAEATKAQILDAAEEEFARFGLMAARTEVIASKTGVTKAMIYYYFSSKEELYQAVLKRHAATFLNTVEQLNLQELSPEEALKQVIRAAIAHEVAYPNQGKILLHEAMQNEGKYFKLTGWEAPIGLGMQLLQKGIDEGYFCPHNPWLMMIHIMGITTFYFNAENNLRNVNPDWQWRTPEALEELTESAIALILRGLKKT
jgi:TetR/AcrR family transcriptional regulator